MKRKLKISGNWDGNIFAIMRNTISVLKKADREDLITEVEKIPEKAKYYYEALGICLKVLKEAGYEVS